MNFNDSMNVRGTLEDIDSELKISNDFLKKVDYNTRVIGNVKIFSNAKHDLSVSSANWGVVDTYNVIENGFEHMMLKSVGIHAFNAQAMGYCSLQVYWNGVAVHPTNQPAVLSGGDFTVNLDVNVDFRLGVVNRFELYASESNTASASLVGWDVTGYFYNKK